MYDLNKYEKDANLSLSEAEIHEDKIYIAPDVYSELSQAPIQVLNLIKTEAR
jgi:hypothetical protein